MPITKDDYVAKVESLKHHCYLYYVLDDSTISDEEYDKLFHEVKDIEEQHEDWILPDSPTQVVGGVDNKRKKFKHPVRMYSLENVFDNNDLTKFFKRFVPLKREVGSAIENFYCDYKMDGLALDLIYVRGKLKAAITRGNGIEGEDVYANAYVVPNIPKHISSLELTCIRGEIVVHKSDFFAYVRECEKNKQPVPSNMRNYAAGSLRQLDPNITAERMLKFYAWELIMPNDSMLYRDEQATKLTELGFNTPGGKLCCSKEEIVSFINDTARKRADLPYGIDGVVIKQNDPTFCQHIGWNNHAPLWATAWKFKADGADTNVTEIRWRVGMTGKLTPVAQLKPVTIDGVTVSAVTMYNAKFVEENKIGIGAHIRVIRSGDVIPKITEVITIGRYKGLPDTCPICGEPLQKTDKELICENHKCPGIFKAFLSYLVGKDVLDIKGIGPMAVNAIVDGKVATSFIDLFTQLDAKGEVSQDVLDKLVMRVRKINLRELLMVLGIPGMGRAIASKITAEVETIKGLKLNLEDPELFRLLPVNDATKLNLKAWYNKEHNKVLLQQIIDLDLPYLS